MIGNPSDNKFSVYLTPRMGNKARAVERIISELATELKRPREDFHVLIAGDSFPDLAIGLCGGLDIEATFLLVGGSRLSSSIIER